MKNYLIGRGLRGVVSGDEPKPEQIDCNNKDWIKKNALALHAIQISYEEDTISKRGCLMLPLLNLYGKNWLKLQSEVTIYKEEGNFMRAHIRAHRHIGLLT